MGVGAMSMGGVTHVTLVSALTPNPSWFFLDLVGLGGLEGLGLRLDNCTKLAESDKQRGEGDHGD